MDFHRLLLPGLPAHPSRHDQSRLETCAQQSASHHTSAAKIATRTERSTREIIGPGHRLEPWPGCPSCAADSRAVSRSAGQPSGGRTNTSRARSPCGRTLRLPLGYSATTGTSTGGDGYLIIKIAIRCEAPCRAMLIRPDALLRQTTASLSAGKAHARCRPAHRRMATKPVRQPHHLGKIESSVRLHTYNT
jgi:hypothetical protein